MTNFPINPHYDEFFEMSDKTPSMSRIEKEPEIGLVIKSKPNAKNRQGLNPKKKKTKQSLNLKNKEKIIS